MYKVEICGVNTSKLPLLTEEEKKTLFDRIQKGDTDAREKFIKGNLRLVLSIIQRFSNTGENIDDLFQIGCIGLMKAIDNFNPDMMVKFSTYHFDVTMNVKFSTYAVPMIIGEVRRYLRDNNSIRVSRSVRDTAYKAIYAKEAMMKESEKEPTIEEVAQKIGIKAENIVLALDAIQNPVSLYEPVYGDGTDTLHIMDQISDKKNKEDSWIEKISLKAAIDHLSDREHKIIKLRYFEGKTQMEVAEEICISQAQVSRLEKKALSSMKHYLG